MLWCLVGLCEAGEHERVCIDWEAVESRACGSGQHILTTSLSCRTVADHEENGLETWVPVWSYFFFGQLSVVGEKCLSQG